MSSQNQYTVSNLVAVAASWGPSSSSSEREKRRKIMERTLDNVVVHISLLTAEMAKSLLMHAVALVHSAANTTRDSLCLVLHQSILLLASLGNDNQQQPNTNDDTFDKCVDQDHIYSVAQELMRDWIFHNESIPPHDAAAVRICALQTLTDTLRYLLPPAVVPQMCEALHYCAKVHHDLADLAMKQKYQKRSFSQGKSSQEQGYQDNAETRIALFELMKVLHERGEGSLASLVPVLLEPGYKARDTMVCRAALSAFAACSEPSVLQEVVSLFPRSVEELFSLSAAPPTKQAMKTRWQDQQTGLLPLWEEPTSILAGNMIVHHAASFCPSRSGVADAASTTVDPEIVAAALGTLLRHPSNKVFVAISTKIVDSFNSSLLNILSLTPSTITTGNAGTYWLERLNTIASTSTSPAHGTQATHDVMYTFAFKIVHGFHVHQQEHVLGEHDGNGYTTRYAAAATPFSDREARDEMLGNAAVVAPWIGGVRATIAHRMLMTTRSSNDASASSSWVELIKLWFLSLVVGIRGAQQGDSATKPSVTKKDIGEFFAVLADAEHVASRLHPSELTSLIRFLGTMLSREYEIFSAAGPRDTSPNMHASSIRYLLRQYGVWVATIIPRLETHKHLEEVSSYLHHAPSVAVRSLVDGIPAIKEGLTLGMA